MSLLVKLVQLYRQLDKPKINTGSVIELRNITLAAELISTITSIWQDDDYKDDTVELSIGIKRYNDRAGCTFLNENINSKIRLLSINLPRSGAHQFYLNIKDFVARANSLDRGELPAAYYIVEDDFLKNSTQSNIKQVSDIEKIEHLCEFIQLLRKTCNFEDQKDNELTRAVFVVSDEESKETLPKTISLEFTLPLLSISTLNLKLLREIVTNDRNHNSEKLSIFRIALWDVLQHARKEDSDLYFIATHWDDILTNFESSYSLYIRGYSFNKFKKEIDDFGLDSINKANNMIGEIALKSLTILSIFTIWLFVLRSPKFDIMFNLGLAFISCFAAIIIIVTIENQQYLLSQLKKTTKRTLEAFSKTPSIYGQYSKKDTSDIDELLDDTRTSIFSRMKRIRYTLITFRIFIWIFSIAICFITASVSWPYSISPWFYLIGLLDVVIISVVRNHIANK